MDKKIKVIIDDIEVEVKISEEELAKLTNAKEPKKTGYERAIHGEYYVMTGDSKVLCESDVRAPYDDSAYESANYYTDKTLAENNARADKLMRQLRRFAAENCEEVPWDNEHAHYGIFYDYISKGLNSHRMVYIRDFGEICFSTEENAQNAIDTFKDELIWYFTEYKDRV